MSTPLDLIFSKVVSSTAQRLSEFGFKKTGNAFRLISDGNAALVEFQKSRDNTSEKLSFTVNIAIVSGLLLDTERVVIQKSRAIDGALNKRIGTFLPDKQDKWWEITNATDEYALSTEVTNVICDMAVPYLLRYIDTTQLVALWESGQSPGLTDGARIMRLEAIKKMIAEMQT